MNTEATKPLCHMKKYDIQLSTQQLKPLIQDFPKQRKDEIAENEIPRKFLINCLISGLYIYFGILLNIFSYCKTLKFINRLSDFWDSEGWSEFFSAVKMLISVSGLVKYTIARYLIGYPFLMAGIISVILSAAAFCSMNGKTSKTTAYKVTRSFANASYFLPLIFAILFIWVMFIPI